METQMIGIGHSPKRGFVFLNLFAYCTKGQPGVEIVGPTKFSRILKEKIIFLSKQRGIKFPLKRFVLCIDIEEEVAQEKEIDFYYWLELPLLLLFWTLSGNLPIHHLQDCIAMGKISSQGMITLGVPPESLFLKLKEKCEKVDIESLKYLSLGYIPEVEGINCLPIQEVFAAIPQIYYKEENLEERGKNIFQMDKLRASSIKRSSKPDCFVMQS